MPSLLRCLFQPLLDACNPAANISLHLRLRLLLLQALSLIVFGFNGINHHLKLHKSFRTVQVPLPKNQGTIRCLVFGSPAATRQGLSPAKRISNAKPLHITIHGGAFVGGIAEHPASFAQKLSEQADCVVVSISYRLAPKYCFPTAHNDVRHVVSWVVANAEQEFGADGSAVTVSGFSVGGNLGLDLAAADSDDARIPLVKAWVGFYSPVRTPGLFCLCPNMNSSCLGL